MNNNHIEMMAIFADKEDELTTLCDLAQRSPFAAMLIMMQTVAKGMDEDRVFLDMLCPECRMILHLVIRLYRVAHGETLEELNDEARGTQQ